MTTLTKPRRGNRHKRAWTKEKVQAAIRRWEQRMGRPPTQAEWNPAQARFIMAGSQARVDRWKKALDEYGTGHYPSARTLQDMYEGKWAEGIKDAGFVPLPVGKPSREALSRYAPRAEHVDEAALLMCIDEVKQALKTDDKLTQRQALLDLASLAATLADEL